MDHEKFMERCCTLAWLGVGAVAPNPMVGCVIVYQGKIIREGFHREYGGPHAEVMAINSVKNPELVNAGVIVKIFGMKHISVRLLLSSQVASGLRKLMDEPLLLKCRKIIS
jgi:pyrimidine deaminase RibD-like protein